MAFNNNPLTRHYSQQPRSSARAPWQGAWWHHPKQTGGGHSGSTTQPSSAADATVAGPPVDPTLASEQASAQLGIGLGNASDVYQTGEINARYGNLDDPSQDAVSNPYSQAALALKRYQQAQTGSTTSYAASGQLYSGALQDASEANTSGYLQNLAGLRQDKQGALDTLTQGAIGRYSQPGATINTDQLASIMKALGMS